MHSNVYYKNNSWDAIGDVQCRKSASTVNLRVALSIEMKNRQPSILYSSRGFLWPKLLTFTCQNSDKPLEVNKAKKIHQSKRKNYRRAEPIHVYKMISPETVNSFQKNSSLLLTKY
jgi:hypothetical protein